MAFFKKCTHVEASFKEMNTLIYLDDFLLILNNCHSLFNHILVLSVALPAMFLF